MEQKYNVWQKIWSVIFIIVPSCYFGYLGKTTEMGLSILSGTIIATFICIDRFEFVKVGNYVAKLREAVYKANVTIENLKEISKPLILTNFNLLISDGYIGEIDPSVKYELAQKLNDIIESLSLEDVEVNSLQEKLQKAIVHSFYSKFVASLKEGYTVSQQLYGLYNPSKNEIESELKKYGKSLDQINQDAKENLKTYIFYKEKLES